MLLNQELKANIKTNMMDRPNLVIQWKNWREDYTMHIKLLSDLETLKIPYLIKLHKFWLMLIELKTGDHLLQENRC